MATRPAHPLETAPARRRSSKPRHPPHPARAAPCRGAKPCTGAKPVHPSHALRGRDAVAQEGRRGLCLCLLCERPARDLKSAFRLSIRCCTVSVAATPSRAFITKSAPCAARGARPCRCGITQASPRRCCARCVPRPCAAPQHALRQGPAGRGRAWRAVSTSSLEHRLRGLDQPTSAVPTRAPPALQPGRETVSQGQRPCLGHGRRLRPGAARSGHAGAGNPSRPARGTSAVVTCSMTILSVGIRSACPNELLRYVRNFMAPGPPAAMPPCAPRPNAPLEPAPQSIRAAASVPPLPSSCAKAERPLRKRRWGWSGTPPHAQALFTCPPSWPLRERRAGLQRSARPGPHARTAKLASPQRPCVKHLHACLYYAYSALCQATLDTS
jgi:hypothetical protein